MSKRSKRSAWSRAACCLLLAWSSLQLPKMKAMCSSGTSVEFHRASKCYFPYDRTLQVNGIVPSDLTFRLVIWKIDIIPTFVEKCCLHIQGKSILFWRWKQKILPKPLYVSTKLQDATSQEIATFVVTAVRIWNHRSKFELRTVLSTVTQKQKILLYKSLQPILELLWT
jgi:hypothetical protein